MKPDLNLLNAYRYELPDHLIAQRPVNPRDSSRLMVMDRASGSWKHRKFSDMVEYFGPQDTLVANNTRVIPARLLGNRVLPDGRTGGAVEFLMLEEKSPRIWEGMFRSSARTVPGLQFKIPTRTGGWLKGVLLQGASESESGTVVAEFDQDPLSSEAGRIPLPPYLGRDPDESDSERYQTAYAKAPGSSAAPTAGLHFTPELLNQLRTQGVSWAEVTLQVGLGTFRPVKTEEIHKHPMHEEKFEIDPMVAHRLSQDKKSGKRITAVGTTSVRTLESAWDDKKSEFRSGAHKTSLFVRPGTHEFKVVNRMITNFHLPESTLLMLVCAFAGYDFTMAAYREAVRERYRFFSYGDAMLIL